MPSTSSQAGLGAEVVGEVVADQLSFAPVVQRLIDELNRLPGIGPKSAQRLALHILRATQDDVDRLSEAMHEVKDKVTFCRTCFNLAEGMLCPDLLGRRT